MATVTVHITEITTTVYEIDVPDAHLNEEFPAPGDPGNWGPRDLRLILDDIGYTAEHIRHRGNIIGADPTTYEIESVTR